MAKAYLFEFSIVASDCEYVSIADLGSPKFQALLLACLKAVGEWGKFPRNYLRDIQDSECSETRSMEYLTNKLKQREHVGMKFRNKVEGFGESVCILAPERLKIINKSEIEKRCLTKAFSCLDTQRFSINSEEFSTALQRALAYCAPGA